MRFDHLSILLWLHVRGELVLGLGIPFSRLVLLHPCSHHHPPVRFTMAQRSCLRRSRTLDRTWAHPSRLLHQCRIRPYILHLAVDTRWVTIRDRGYVLRVQVPRALFPTDFRYLVPIAHYFPSHDSLGRFYPHMEFFESIS